MARTAEVQGMCTYEDLVDATLPHGLVPLVVPQLRTITLGGAVTGLGIESTSFRNGLPHESVLEMDVLTGAGELRHRQARGRPVRRLPQLLRLAGLRHPAAHRARAGRAAGRAAARAVRDARPTSPRPSSRSAPTRTWEGEPGRRARRGGVQPRRELPDAGALDRRAGARPATGPGATPTTARCSSAPTDLLTTYDYLWRWDTDWFWCSGAFGLHDPRVRRLWPRRWRRSDVYHRLVGLDARARPHRPARRAGRTPPRAGRPGRRGPRRPHLPEFVALVRRGRRDAPGVAVPAAAARARRAGERPHLALLPADPRHDVRQRRVLGHRPARSRRAATATATGPSRPRWPRLGGHKSLYSDAYYDEATFASLYGTDHLDRLRAQLDPDGRLPSLYDKAVRRR